MARVFEKGFWIVTIDESKNMLQVEYDDIYHRHPFRMSLEEARDMPPEELIRYIQDNTFDFPPKENGTWNTLLNLIMKLRDDKIL